MNKFTYRYAMAGIILLVSSSSCVPYRKEQKTMSLGDALIAVSDGLDKASKHAEANSGRKKHGLMPDETTVSLVISETTTKEGGINVNLTPANFPGTLGGSYKGGTSDKLENTIQVKLKSAYFAPAATPFSKWDVEQIRNYLDHGIVPPLDNKDRPVVPPKERIGLFRKIIDLEKAGKFSTEEANTMLKAAAQ